MSDNKKITQLFNWIFSFFSSLFLVFIFISVLMKIIPFDTDIEQYKDVLLPKAFMNCAPEPQEFMAYTLTIISFPILFYIIYSLVAKSRKIAGNKAVPYITSGIFLCFVLGILNIAVYCILKEELMPLGFLISLPLSVLCLYFIRKKSNDNTKSQNIIFFSVMSIVLVFGFVRVSSLNFMMQDETFNHYHYYAWWYPVYKVASGQHIGIDFENIYGFYPYFTVPVLKLTGGVNQHSASIFIAIIITIVSLGYYIFCYRFIKNKITAVITATICSFIGPLTAIGGDIYLQYFPNRALFFSLMLILISVHSSLTKPVSKTAVTVLSCITAGIGICWNTETGIIASVLWAAYYFYSVVSSKGLFTKKTLSAIFKAILFVIISVIIFILTAEMITYSLSGQFIGKEQLLFGIIVFAGVGCNMLPIDFIGLWTIAALILLAGLSLTVIAIVSKKDEKTIHTDLTGLFTISVLGIGAFSYFIGRSHANTIRPIIPECVVVCAFLAEHLLSRIKGISFAEVKKSSFTEKSSFIISYACAFLCSVFIINFASQSIDKIKTNLSKEYNELNYGDPDLNSAYQYFYVISEKIKDWSEHSNNGQLPDMLTFYSAYYDELLGKTANENVCEMIDWFYKDKAYSYIEYLRAHPDHAFVIGSSAVRTLTEEFNDEFTAIMDNYTLSETFRGAEHEGSKIYIYSPINK